MPSEAVLIGIGALAGSLIAAASGILAVVREHRWRERQELAKERRMAYTRYLIAQQALRDKFAERDPEAVSHRVFETAHMRSWRSTRARRVPAPSRAWIDGAQGRAAEAWRESGAAEMNARLVAGGRVFVAINRFEIVANAASEAARRNEKIPDGWEDERGKLIEAMRDEQVPRSAGAPRRLRSRLTATRRRAADEPASR